MAEEDDHHLSFKEGCNMNTTLDQMSKFQIFSYIFVLNLINFSTGSETNTATAEGQKN